MKASTREIALEEHRIERQSRRYDQQRGGEGHQVFAPVQAKTRPSIMNMAIWPATRQPSIPSEAPNPPPPGCVAEIKIERANLPAPDDEW
jgi:hypothetical protein